MIRIDSDTELGRCHIPGRCEEGGAARNRREIRIGVYLRSVESHYKGCNRFSALGFPEREGC